MQESKQAISEIVCILCFLGIIIIIIFLCIRNIYNFVLCLDNNNRKNFWLWEVVSADIERGPRDSDELISISFKSG